MSINLVISEIYCNFKELKYKQLQTKIAMITEDKVTEIFCMADDFCKFFDAMTAKYTLKPTGKRKYHRNSTMSKGRSYADNDSIPRFWLSLLQTFLS